MGSRPPPSTTRAHFPSIPTDTGNGRKADIANRFSLKIISSPFAVAVGSTASRRQTSDWPGQTPSPDVPCGEGWYRDKQTFATSFLIKLLPFPGHAKFLCLLPVFIMFPLPGVSFPLPLGWLQKLPPSLQSQSHVPAPRTDFPDPTVSHARSSCPDICPLRYLQCTYQSTFPHLLL